MLPDLGSRGLFNCISFMLWQAGMLQHSHLSHSACSTGVTGTPCPVQPKTAACRSESPRSSFYIAAAPDLMGMGGSQTLLAVSWQAPPKPLLSSSRQFPLQTGLFCCTKPHCGMNWRQDLALFPALKTLPHPCYMPLNSCPAWVVSRALLPFTLLTQAQDRKGRDKGPC